MDLDLNGQKLFNYRKEDINISESIQFKKIPTKESKTNIICIVINDIYIFINS